MKVGDAIAEILKREGVDTIIGYPAMWMPVRSWRTMIGRISAAIPPWCARLQWCQTLWV
jgi:hypothetical protein